MFEIIIERALPSHECADALHTALKTALGDKCDGFHTTKGLIHVVMADDATEMDTNTARQLVLNHDMTLRSPEQVRIQLREAYLAEARERFVAGKVDMDKLSVPDIKELVYYLLMEVDYLRNK